MKKISLIGLLVLFTQLTTLAQYAQVRGTVTTTDGQPAPFVSVQLAELKKGTQSDQNGIFELDALPVGTYTLVASFVGYKTLKEPVTLQADKVLHLQLELVENVEALNEIVVKAFVTPNNRPISVGKMAARPLDLPMAIQTIDHSTLISQQVLTLQDVLMNTNGVYVMGATGGYQDEVAGRGFAYGSNNTFKNGVRFINSMMPELSSVERVEVLRGSAALLYGNVAPGGVINLVTKKPRFDRGGEVMLRTGSFGLIKPVFDVYGGIGKGEKVAFRVNGTYEKANSFRQYVHSERFYINPSLLVKLGKNTEFLAEGDYLNDQRMPDFGTGILNYEIIPDYPRDRFLGVKWGYVKSKQGSATATLTHHFSEKWKLVATSSYRDTKQELFAVARPNSNGLIGADGLWTRNIQRNDNYNDYFIAQADLTGEFLTGTVKHQLLAGFDTDHFTQQTQRYHNLVGYDVVSIFEDLPENSRNDVPTLNKNDFTDNPTNRYGIYAQDLIHFSEKWKVLAGLRYSNIKASTAVTNDKGEKTVTDNPAEGAFSPRLGVVFQPTPNHALFASYSNSFELNTGVDVDGNALPPSIIDQVEAGIKNDFLRGKASLNLTVYQIDNANMAQTSLQNGNTYTYIKELAGHVRSRGVEVDFDSRPLPQLRVMAGYSYNLTRYIQSNTYIDGSLLRYNPNHTANASVQYQFLPGLNAGFTSAYIGKRYAGRSTRVQVENDERKLIEIPAYFQFDATAGYTYKQFALRFKLANVFNVLSYNVHDDNSVNPIAPSNFSVSLRYAF